LVHLLHRESLVDEPNAVLEGEQLFVSHYVGVYIFTEGMGPLISHIELIHSSVVQRLGNWEIYLLSRMVVARYFCDLEQFSLLVWVEQRLLRRVAGQWLLLLIGQRDSLLGHHSTADTFDLVHLLGVDMTLHVTSYVSWCRHLARPGQLHMLMLHLRVLLHRNRPVYLVLSDVQPATVVCLRERSWRNSASCWTSSGPLHNPLLI